MIKNVDFFFVIYHNIHIFQMPFLGGWEMEIDKKIEDLAEILKSIGHPVRLTILLGLVQKRSCVKEIWDCLGLPQATVSQHLAVLKNKKIVGVKKLGVRREYYVSNAMVEKLLKFILEGEGENG